MGFAGVQRLLIYIVSVLFVFGMLAHLYMAGHIHGKRVLEQSLLGVGVDAEVVGILYRVPVVGFLLFLSLLALFSPALVFAMILSIRK